MTLTSASETLSRWKPYPAYKNSGVEWLGKVPEHWLPKRIKHCAPLVNEKVDGKQSSLPYLGLENIESKTGRQIPSDTQQGSEGQANCFRAGDVLFGKLRPYLAKVLKATEDGICTSELLVLQPKFITHNFLFYFLLSPDVINQIDASTFGAQMPRADWDFIGNMPIRLPPEDEQCAIAGFLDRETARIDALIEKKQRQIELLKEKRAALINNVSTKGINPSATLKPSGSPWLGNVPEHWDVVRAKVIFEEIDDRSTTGQEELLTVSHLTGVTRRSEKDVNMFLAESLEDYKICKPNDLVINTMWAWMGALGFSQEDGIVSPSYNVYRFRNNKQEPAYYDQLFRTGKFVAEIARYSKGIWSSRLRLYPEEFFEIRIPCPPQEEQRAIVQKIQEATGSYDVLQRKLESSIVTLQEYRSALISAAVTGNIDVRQSRHTNGLIEDEGLK